MVLGLRLPFPTQSLAVPTAAPVLTRPAMEVAYLLAAVLLVGPSEEVLFRSAVQGGLRDSFGSIGGIVLASSLFTAVHSFVVGPGGPVVGLTLQVFAFGVLAGVFYERTRTVLVPALVHGIFNGLPHLVNLTSHVLSL